MCPAAAPRTASPAITKKEPAAIQVHVGRANHKYAAAKTKPSGTRNRVAILAQLGTGASQEMAGCANHLIGPDLQQAFIGLPVMGKRGDALRMPQGNCLVAEWAGASRVGRSIQADDRYAQGRSQVQWTGVSTNRDTRASRKRNQLSDRAVHQESIPAAGCHYRLTQGLFTRGHVHQRFQVVTSQRLGYGAESLRRPLLGAPACAGSHQCKAGNS